MTDYYLFDLDVEHAGCLNRVKVWKDDEVGGTGKYVVAAERPSPFGDWVGAESYYESPLDALIAGLECIRNAAEAEDLE